MEAVFCGLGRGVDAGADAFGFCGGEGGDSACALQSLEKRTEDEKHQVKRDGKKTAGTPAVTGAGAPLAGRGNHRGSDVIAGGTTTDAYYAQWKLSYTISTNMSPL